MCGGKKWHFNRFSIVKGTCFRVTTHLFELLISKTVELDDELAVGGRDLSTGVNDLDDVQLLPQAHLRADLPTQILNVLHLKTGTKTCSIVQDSLPPLKTEGVKQQNKQELN